MFLLGLATVVAAPFSAATASASAKGTVKINGTDIGIANDPNVDCPVTVSFFNFDDFTGGISSYTGNAPSRRFLRLPTSLATWVFQSANRLPGRHQPRLTRQSLRPELTTVTSLTG